MTGNSRRRLTVDQRRGQLLELALDLFATRPYEEVSIDEIASAAGVSKGLLYHYFGSKREFYIAGVRLGARQLMEVIEPASVGPPLQQLTTALNAYLDYVDARATPYRSLIRGGIGVDAEVAELVEDARKQIIARISTGLGLTQSRPLFYLAIRSWLGAVEAACLEWLERRNVERGALVQMLLANLYSNVKIACLRDPDAGVTLDQLSVALFGGPTVSVGKAEDRLAARAEVDRAEPERAGDVAERDRR